MTAAPLDSSSKATLFDAVISNPTVGLALLNRDGQFIFCNPTLEKMLGYDDGELQGKSFLEITHPADQEWSRTKWNAMDDRPVVKRYLTKRGETVWVSLAITVLGGSSPGSVWTMALAQDVTKEYDASAKLHENDLVFRQLMENISLVFWMTDPGKQKMVYLSPAYETIWGLSCDSVYADPLLFVESIHPEDRERVLGAMPLQAQGKYNLEYRIVRPDGQLRTIHDRAFPVRNDSGEIYRVCGIAQDITELKEHERIMTDQRMKIAASAKLSSLGEMAAGVAHEINSPLAAIQLNVEMLRETMQTGDFDRDAVEKMLTGIENTVKRVSKIVRSLRRLGRDSRDDPYELAQVRAIVEETVELCRERFKHRLIRLEVDDIPENCAIECRPVEISQLLLNLLNNACDAVEDQKERWVRVEFSSLEREIELAVCDSGAGIPPELRSELFVPFFTTKEVGKGTGLGLPICVSIAKSHKGNLELDTASARTRFVLKLPKAIASKQP